MRWDDFRRSDNVEDAGSGGGGFPFGGGFRLGGGAIIAVVVISLLLGKNPLEILGLLESAAPPPSQVSVQPGPGAAQPNDPQRDFVRAIVGDTEDFWSAELARHGVRYQPPKLALFHGQVGSACGFASAAMGPFYCPGDERVYLDLSFFRDLSQRFGAPGDFARAYVIAHEIGHHVQNQLGLMQKVQERSANASERTRNALSVRQELQADCFAGVWGHSAQQRGALDTRDIEQGLAAASSVGDDRLQQQSRGYAVPESFTHGSSEQRVRWFRVGLSTGDLNRCDTFAAASL
ncbi:MAG TPA: neutral zinc metallopeptidase [Casimicrobiaceae bacterium]|jgi:predicted metalloprotease|nr:neutral zinc metallopeptidase [Casimicrobiaceae bacterium]